MKKTRILVIAAATLLAVAAASAQPYPSRPLRLILPSAPGGLPDIQARLMANELSKQLGQTVIVENRAGGSTLIGFEAMAKASPDGYSVGYATFPVATNPAMHAKLPYDFDRDFRAVIHQVSALNILAVSPALPVKSVQELVAHAKANPGKLSYGVSAWGASNHLSIELIRMMTGINVVAVPYKAIQQAIADTTTGQIHIVCDNMGSILPHVKAGRVRGLGVTSPKRSPAMPDMPTVAEQGLPGYEIMPWSGYVVPKKTSGEIVKRLNVEFNKALFSPTVTERMAAMGSIPVGGTPEQFAEHVHREIAKWGKVIRAAGITPQ